MRILANRIGGDDSLDLVMWKNYGVEIFNLCWMTVKTIPIDSSNNKWIRDFKCYNHLVLTSPEAARRFNQVFKLFNLSSSGFSSVWCPGRKTFETFQSGSFKCRTFVANPPGSEVLLSEMSIIIKPIDRILVITSLNGGKQFSLGLKKIGCKVYRISLYKLVAKTPELEAIEQALNFESDTIVHGSSNLTYNFVKWAKKNQSPLLNLVHCVTSEVAENHLPAGSKYHRLSSPEIASVVRSLGEVPNVR